MQLKKIIKVLSVSSLLLTSAYADSDLKPGISWNINYDWMDAIINKTPAKDGACPSLEVDLYKSGFQVAREKSFFGTIGRTGSKWFPKDERWATVGVGPVSNSFGIFFSEIRNLDNMTQEKQKKLPDSAEEIAKWKVTDSAYWESQGGVAFYLGTGVFPYEIGIFTVATGGWVNYLQKTGPNKVYVETSKKYINSVSFGAGISFPNISIETVKESSHGFAYQFNLDNQETIEAFERFMAGDVTKAQDLSLLKDSGVMKISNMSEDRTGLSKSWGVTLPFIPLLSFKSSTGRAYDHMEENSVWDEKIIKDSGIYVKQRSTRLVDNHVKEAKSFVGGRVLVNLPTGESERNITESVYGNFKYSYQSDWGQERRLRKYIARVKSLTGLVDETCITVPKINDSLQFNQVLLEVKWSDSYLREIIGLTKSTSQSQSNKTMLEKIKKIAKGYRAHKSSLDICNVPDNDKYDDTCSIATAATIESSFKNLESYASNMKKNFQTNKKEFTRNLTKFGEEVWKSPFVFKAFFDKGKECGQEFKYEVSGQRITRRVLSQKFAYTENCTAD